MTSKIARNEVDRPLRGGQKLVTYIVAVSSLMTVFTTTYQLYAEYKRDLNAIDNTFELIQEGYLPAISEAIRGDDTKQLTILLAGILTFPDISYVEIQENYKFTNKLEIHKADSIQEKSYSLYSDYSGADRKLGILVAHADMSTVYNRILERFWFVLFLNAAIIFSVTFLIFLVVNRIVIRPLKKMTDYSANLSIEGNCSSLVLDRGAFGPPLELNLLAASINKMNIRLKEQFQNLSASELYFRRFFDGSSLCLCVAETDGTICRVNANLCELMNLEDTEILGKRISSLMNVSDLEERTFIQSLEEGINIELTEERALSYLDKTGTLKYISISMGNVTDETGSIRWRLFEFRDTTERKIAVERLKTLQKLDVLGNLASSIAHDFNNMLAIIQSNVDIIVLKKNDPNAVLARLSVIKDTISDSAKIIQRLLPLTRQKAFDEKTIPLHEFIANSESLIRASVHDDIELNVTLAGEDLLVFVDQHQLQNALVNIVANAQDAISGAGNINIHVSTRQFDKHFSNRYGTISAGDYVEIAVIDNGKGIPEQSLSKLFDPFNKATPFGKGGGVGLSLVHRFVTQSGGLVDVNSSVGEGTNITLYLPYIKDQNRDISQHIPINSVLYGSETILIIEENDNFASSIGKTVNEYGYFAFITKNDIEAIEWLKSGKQADLVLIGLSLPDGKSDFVATDILVADDADYEIIVMATFSDAKHFGNYSNNHKFSVLEKPFSDHDLLALIRSKLNINNYKLTEYHHV
ncbi:MAG: ATP-binding protein [Sneathiella sp.]